MSRDLAVLWVLVLALPAAVPGDDGGLPCEGEVRERLCVVRACTAARRPGGQR